MGLDCNKAKVVELLPDYFSGHLSEDDLLLVEAHLPGCRSCQERLSIMGLLSDNSEHNRDAGSQAHISPDLLARYYESRDLLDDSITSKIDAHLKSCKQCTRELTFLRGLESDLLATDHAEKPYPGLVTAMLRETWATLRRPAFAYVLIALMLYPTIDWLYNEMNTTPRTNPQKVFFLSEQTRSEGEIPLVVRTIRNQVIPLRVPFFHFSLEKKYEFVFTNFDSDSIVAAEVISNFDEKGSIQLLANFRPLSDGSYLLSILEIDKIDETNRSETFFPFKLETATK